MEFVHRPGVEVEGGGDGADLASGGHNWLPRIGGFERGEPLLVAAHEIGDAPEHIASASHGGIPPYTLIEASSGDLDCQGDIVGGGPADCPDLSACRRIVNRNLASRAWCGLPIDEGVMEAHSGVT